MVLTAEQQAALGHGEAVPVVVDQTECVLLRKDVFERIQELFDDWDPRLMRRYVGHMMTDDWDDPAMSVYDR